jgi:DNA-directed RNA polymerase subunit D
LNIRIISLTEDKLTFLLEGVDTAFANALRRTMMSEVPIMAIEDIFYFDNTSLIPDEVLAHRIGLVPLTTDLEDYLLPEDCDCESELGCPKCRVILTLDVEAEDDTITVYSGEMESEDPKIVPASKNIPLAKLAPNQAIRFEAYAQLGKGKEHAKWSPVSMCVYQNVSMVPVTDNVSAEECVKQCGEQVAEIEEDNLKIINILKFESCKLCRDLISHEEIMGNLKEDEFFFTVESNGALSPEKIVRHAVRILKDKLATLSGKIDRNELSDEITDFGIPEFEEGTLYTVGSGEYDDEEEGGEDFTGGDVEE